MTDKFYIHVICDNRRIRYLFTQSVPRVGDEIRLTSRDFYKVTSIVWCFDEPVVAASCGQRVNIGVERVVLARKRTKREKRSDAYGDQP